MFNLFIRTQALQMTQSCSNKAEASAIVTITKRLVKAGIAAEAIGVICFFRAQASSTHVPRSQQATKIGSHRRDDFVEKQSTSGGFGHYDPFS